MVNKVILVGRLGRDPELRYTPKGQAVANFTMATNEVWRNQDGERQERTEWHRIVVWGKTAEFSGNYLAKGRQVFVEGRLQTREWEDRDGNKRWTTEIVAQNLQLLGSRRDAEGGGGDGDYGPGPGSDSSGSGSADTSGSADPPPSDNDIPF